MLRVFMIALVARMMVGVSGLMSFLNPPSHSNLEGDLSKAVSYKAGQVINVVWTPADQGQAASVVLWQLDNETGVYFGDLEYLTQGVINVNKYSWLVGTRKDLSVSNLFYLSIFQEGKGGSADDNSEYMYITKDEVSEQAMPSSASTASAILSAGLATSTMTGLTISTSAVDPSKTSPSPSSYFSNTPLTTATSSETFPLAAKVGIGVGIPVALALGLGIGWFMFRQHKQRKKTPVAIEDTVDPTSLYGPLENKYQYDSSSHYGSHMYEAPTKSPLEMARSIQNDNAQSYPAQAPSQAAVVRYEM